MECPIWDIEMGIAEREGVEIDSPRLEAFTGR